MRLSLNVAANSNGFSKAIRRIRPRFNSLFEEFAAKQLLNPIHEAILLSVTDSMKNEEIEVVPNREGFLQIICGFGAQSTFSPANDRELEVRLFQKIRSAIELCPFSKPDKAMMLALLHDWSYRELPITGDEA